MLQNRQQAGELLARKLEDYKDKDAIVLALPRGGVVLGYEIAKALHLPLDIIVTRKIGHPENQEYAMCAVDNKGTLICNESEQRLVDKKWLAREVERQVQEAVRRVKVYRGERPQASIRGNIAIIVDDGIATGLTMRLAIAIIKKAKPSKIIVAVPVAPPDITRELKQEVDWLVTLLPPEDFLGAVGSSYLEFDQVEDDEVIKLLNT